MGTVLGPNSLQGYQHTQKVAASKKRIISHLWIYVLKSTTHKFTLNSKIKIKIAIRGDGKSPDQKVIDMQLQAANLVYIFDVIILSVTANKSGRLTVETSFLPLNSQASSYKVHSREITYKSSKGEQQFLNARHPLDLLYIYTIYYQNISKDIKVIERTSFPL